MSLLDDNHIVFLNVDLIINKDLFLFYGFYSFLKSMSTSIFYHDA